MTFTIIPKNTREKTQITQTIAKRQTKKTALIQSHWTWTQTAQSFGKLKVHELSYIDVIIPAVNENIKLK